jgi:hypothetical protein
MPALARGQENTESILNWFLTVNNVLTDAFEVGYRIFDLTAGLPGTQIFPVTPGDYEPVTAPPGNFSTGSYYAYDNGNAQGYTPGLAQPIGTHRIEWRWKISGAAPYQSGFEDFEVLVQSAGSSAETYCSVQDIRDEGITVAMADDAKVLSYIETWQQFIDRACRQWFNARAMILEVDGNDGDSLFFSVPIIQIDYLKLNHSAENLDESLFRAYTGRLYPDDRRNPRIKLIGPGESRNIYVPASRLTGRLKFLKGRQNQEIKGIFGYTEADGSTPKLIRRALIKLVIEKLTAPIFEDPGAVSPVPSVPPILGPILEEETDDHRIKYGQAGGATVPRRAGLSGITQDTEILDILKLYKGPMGVGAPAHWGNDW